MKLTLVLSLLFSLVALNTGCGNAAATAGSRNLKFDDAQGTLTSSYGSAEYDDHDIKAILQEALSRNGFEHESNSRIDYKAKGTWSEAKDSLRVCVTNRIADLVGPYSQDAIPGGCITVEQKEVLPAGSKPDTKADQNLFYPKAAEKLTTLIKSQIDGPTVNNNPSVANSNSTVKK
jgi:hypothetical protein